MSQLPGTWPIYAVILFGIAAGQLARLGQRLERGEILGLRHLIAEVSMLPALGSLGGVLAASQDWSVWVQLGAGIAAGWIGFDMFRLIAGGFHQAAVRLMDTTRPERESWLPDRRDAAMDADLPNDVSRHRPDADRPGRNRRSAGSRPSP